MNISSPARSFNLFNEDCTVNLIYTSSDFERLQQNFGVGCSQIVDSHFNHGVSICYLQIPTGEAQKSLDMKSTGVVREIVEGIEFGTLIKLDLESKLFTVWIPPSPIQFGYSIRRYDELQSWFPTITEILYFDKHGRISSTGGSIASVQWQHYPHLKISVSVPAETNSGTIVLPYLLIEDPLNNFFEEISKLSEVEKRLYRKTSWFYPRKPADLWNHLINGSLYDPRFSDKIRKRFKCQQCAYTWWSYFSFLKQETQKIIYDALQDEIAYSILIDIETDGQWKHGYTSDKIETHVRFCLDGVHLLLSQYQKTSASLWLSSARESMNYLLENFVEEMQAERVWFLHDSLEGLETSHYFKSRLFGKSVGNSLCVNTHVQAMTVLYRLDKFLPHEKIYQELFQKAAQSLKMVLEYQPADWLYAFLSKWVWNYRTANSSQSRVRKILAPFEYLTIRLIYWLVRSQFPRIVMPNGFIERDLTVSFAPDGYHIINLKDLLTLYKQEPFPWLTQYIQDGVELVRKIDLICVLDKDSQYIEWIDTLYMFSTLIEHIPSQEMEKIEQQINQVTGGYSIDHCASELVRIPSREI